MNRDSSAHLTLYSKIMRNRAKFSRNMKCIICCLTIVRAIASTPDPYLSDVSTSADPAPATTTENPTSGVPSVASNLITVGPDISFQEFMTILDPSAMPVHVPVSMDELWHEIETSASVPPAAFDALESGILFHIASDAALSPPDELWDQLHGGAMLELATSDSSKREHLVVPLVALVSNLGIDGEDDEIAFAETTGLATFCDNFASVIYSSLLRDHRENWKTRRVVRTADNFEALNWLIIRQTYMADFPYLCPRIFSSAPTEVRLIPFVHAAQHRRLLLSFGGILPEDLHDIDRAHAFSSWVRQRARRPNQLGVGYVSFKDEVGSGSGVIRDWVREACSEMFNASYGLFTRNAEGRYVVDMEDIRSRPRWRSELRAAGTLIGLSIVEQIPLGVELSIPLMSFLLEKPLEIADLEEDDISFARNLNSLRTMGVEELGALSLSFNNRGTEEDLTVANREAYIRYKLDGLIKKSSPMENLRIGFAAVLPAIPPYIRPVDVRRAIYGNPFIDVEQLIGSMRLHGYETSSDQVVWLLKLLRVYDQDQLKSFLGFVTGSSVVPFGGFSALPNPIMIIKSGENPSALPRSRTCFAHLFLPLYPSEAVLRDRVTKAISLDGSMGLV